MGTSIAKSMKLAELDLKRGTITQHDMDAITKEIKDKEEEVMLRQAIALSMAEEEDE